MDSIPNLNKRMFQLAFGTMILNAALVVWSLYSWAWDRILLNLLGVAVCIWVMKIMLIHKPKPVALELCDAVDDLLTNMYDSGEAEEGDIGEEKRTRADVNRVERLLAEVRLAAR